MKKFYPKRENSVCFDPRLPVTIETFLTLLLFYQMLHFIFSKNVKIGIKCSITVPDSPHKEKQRHWIPMALFFILHKLLALIFLWINLKI